jgi:hypothetical protein
VYSSPCSDPASAPCNSSDPNHNQLVQARGVANRYQISVRTLDRWLQKPHLVFPRAVMVTHDVTGRVCARFWRVSDLVEWERKQAASQSAVTHG